MARASWLTAFYYVALFALLVLVHRALIDYVADDAYIHLRVAEHLVHDGVPYFNPAEPVKASSSSLRTIILAALFAVCGVGVYPVALLNCAATCLTVFVCSRLAKQALATDRFWIDLLTTAIVVSLSLESSVSLMETPLALLVVTLGIQQYLRRRAVAFFFLAAAVFLRIEFAVFLLFTAAHSLATGAVPLRKWLPFALAGAVPCLAYDFYYFGSIVPQAMTTKTIIYRLSLVEFGMATYRFVFGPHWCQDLVALLVTYQLTVPGIFLYGFLRTRRQAPGGEPRHAAMLLFVPGAAIFVAYLLKQVLVFPWYVPLFTVPMFMGMFLATYSRSSVALRRVFLLLLCPALFNLGVNLSAAAWNKSWYTDFAFGARTRRYIDVADKLYRKYPQATLLSTEAGGLGSRFQGRFIDAAGLISPAALKHHPMLVPQQRSAGYLGSIPPEFVREAHPDIIVSYDAMMENLAQSDVLADYVQEVVPPLLPDDLAISDVRQHWFGRQLNIFVRKDAYRGPIETGTLVRVRGPAKGRTELADSRPPMSQTKRDPLLPATRR